MKEYKVIDLSYTDDPERHLKEVRAYQEGDGWRLLTVVHASGKWLYYLEREAAEAPEPPGGVATAVGSERGLPGPVRRIEGGSAGEVVTAGADVTAEGASVEVRRCQSRGLARVLPELSKVRVTRDLTPSLVPE